jgi:hypothetical protein|eukprot:COSAG06_NODE_4831_length_3924_cov_46.863529_3_plen_79_part_00
MRLSNSDSDSGRQACVKCQCEHVVGEAFDHPTNGLPAEAVLSNAEPSTPVVAGARWSAVEGGGTKAPKTRARAPRRTG